MPSPFVNEADVWRYLAERFREPNLAVNDKGEVYAQGVGYGLCFGIQRLCCSAKLITTEMMGKMRERINRHHTPYERKNTDEYGYKWPLTKSGARSRRAFCKRMALLCQKEQACPK